MEVSCEFITKLVTERLDIKSFTTLQFAPESVLFQMPPVTLPTHIVVVVVGCIRIARMRPPILPGPRDVQDVVEMPATAPTGLLCAACIIAFICTLALISALGGMYPFSSTRERLRHAAASRG